MKITKLAIAALAAAALSMSASADGKKKSDKKFVGTYQAVNTLDTFSGPAGTFSCVELLNLGAVPTCTNQRVLQFRKDGSSHVNGGLSATGYFSEGLGFWERTGPGVGRGKETGVIQNSDGIETGTFLVATDYEFDRRGQVLTGVFELKIFTDGQDPLDPGSVASQTVTGSTVARPLR